MSAWLLVVPLMLAGTEVAHALAYRLVYPQAAVRLQVLAATGHSYLSLAPLIFGIAGAIGLAGLLTNVVDAARRRGVRPVPPLAFGLLPLAAFTIQEFMERWLALGGFPWWMVLQPTFRIGLLLQLPFGLCAFLIARLLFRAARRVGVALRGAPPLALPAPRSSWHVRAVLPLRASVLASGHAGRGPPLLARPPLSLCV